MTCGIAQFQRRLAALLLIVAGSLLPSSGCYRYHVYQVGGTSGREQGNQPGTEWAHKTLHAFAWGAIRQDIPVDNCQLATGQRLGIEEVRVDTNMAYLVASVATLGLWVPLSVSWRCAKPPAPTGTLRREKQ